MKNEWSLIIFTLLIQLAAGSFVVLALMNTRSFNKYMPSLPAEILNRFLLLILAAAVIAVITSFFHLGNPFSSIYSLNNLKTSWLSREILFVILFFTSLTIYFILDTVLISNQQIKFIIGIITAVFGISLIYSMSRLYMLETVPAWNTIFTPAKFFLTAALLGIIAFLTVMISSASSNFLSDHGLLVKRILQITIILLLAELTFFIIELWFMNSGNPALVKSFKLMTENNGILFYSHIILFALAILFLLYQLTIAGSNYSVPLLAIISILIILLQITQRFLFYSSYNRLGV